LPFSISWAQWALMRNHRFLPTLSLLLVLSAAPACGKFRPHSTQDAEFHQRAQTQEQGKISVSVAALGDKESKYYFGVPLAKKGVQPLWIKIVNNDTKPYWLQPISIDPDYFSPNEAAYRHHFGHAKRDQARMDIYFNDQQVNTYIPPGQTASGFLYTNIDQGAKAVSVELLAEKEQKRFSFVVPVPGLKADFTLVDFDALYKPGEIRDVSLPELRQELEKYPCCTFNKKLTKNNGDAVNLVLIGDDEDLITAFIRRGWKETAAQDKGSSMRMFKAFFFKSTYENAPMGKLYLLERGQDMSFQKPRRTIHQRNHLRLWMTPLRYQGKAVWIGTISRDIGIRATLKSPFFMTHKIDSDLDEARDFVLQDLLASEAVGSFGYVKGVGESSYEHPIKNAMGDTWYTDGLRVVVFFTDYPTPVLDVKQLPWETPPQEHADFFKAYPEYLEADPSVPVPISAAPAKAPAGKSDL
ncbi:MAG: LssY C-terminal domain-containing protein, partial [Deltaproteobacteria bacterium]|nr:LssY C-terminal domain-containing protein [Deltaproteobacteria bacterium]